MNYSDLIESFYRQIDDYTEDYDGYGLDVSEDIQDLYDIKNLISQGDLKKAIKETEFLDTIVREYFYDWLDEANKYLKEKSGFEKPVDIPNEIDEYLSNAEWLKP